MTLPIWAETLGADKYTSWNDGFIHIGGHGGTPAETPEDAALLILIGMHDDYDLASMDQGGMPYSLTQGFTGVGCSTMRALLTYQRDLADAGMELVLTQFLDPQSLLPAQTRWLSQVLAHKSFWPMAVNETVMDWAETLTVLFADDQTSDLHSRLRNVAFGGLTHRFFKDQSNETTADNVSILSRLLDDGHLSDCEIALRNRLGKECLRVMQANPGQAERCFRVFNICASDADIEANRPLIERGFAAMLNDLRTSPILRHQDKWLEKDTGIKVTDNATREQAFWAAQRIELPRLAPALTL